MGKEGSSEARMADGQIPRRAGRGGQLMSTDRDIEFTGSIYRTGREVQ